MNYEVAPVVRPILPDDLLTSKGVLVVFGVERNSSFVQWSDGHKIPSDQGKWSNGVERDVG